MSWLPAPASSYYEEREGPLEARTLGAHVEKLARRETYGPFEVLERLGVGGMAVVHRAIERSVAGFEREVALKRLLPHLAEDAAFVRLFVREAKLASLLQHGNIVQLYELGRVGPSYFISMEYIVGRDLRAAIRQARRVVGPPPVAISLAILSELLDALDYAHTRRDETGVPLGLVHRDISPSNLIINESGHLKVIDFGVAMATHGELKTQTGGIKGKLSYMPPEMLVGRPLDGRSDLFAASVIAHELLTTAPLFTGDSEFQTMERVQHMAPPPPSAKNRECPPELDAVVLKGLSKEPDRRWSSAAVMRAELNEIAVRFRLHATSRDVAGWIDWAFGPGASRRPMPLSAPEEASSASSRQSDSQSDADSASGSDSERSPIELHEGEFEAAWDWLRACAAPIVIADVPDVSNRLVASAPAEERAAEPEDDDAPTLAVELLPDEDVVALVESGALAAEMTRKDDSVIALAGPEGIGALTWANRVVAVADGPDSGPVVTRVMAGAGAPRPVYQNATGPTVRLGPVSLGERREVHPPAEWADGTPSDAAAPDRAQLALATEPSPPHPRFPFVPAPLTLGDRLGAPLGRWRTPEPPIVRLRPSAMRAFFIFLVASVAITAGTAYILRGDTPPPRKVGHAAPPPVRPAPAQPAAPVAALPASPVAADAPALVPPDRVKKKHGKRPVLRVAQTGQTPAALDSEVCVDRRGAVASVKILTPVSIAARAALTRELGQWRYRPIRRDGERVAGCFAVQVRPVFK